MFADNPRLGMMLTFTIHSTIMGGLFSRIAEVQRDLQLDAERFGLAMAGMAAGVLLGLPVSAALCDALGNRKLTMLMFAGAALAVPLVGLAPGFWALFGAVLLLGLTTSMANQAMNIEADRLALATGRPLLALSHAVWGVGFLVSSSLGALAIRVGITPLTQLYLLAALVLAGVVLIVAPFRESPPRPHSGAPVARIALPDRANMALLGYAASGLVAEMILRNWSVIYLRDIFGAADWLAALSLPVFVLTQTAGRFALAGLAARFGVGPVAQALTLITLTGIAMMVLANGYGVAMLGCALIGLGTAATYPLAFSALARMTSRTSGESMAGFSILQNLLWLVAPPLFGMVASGVDMRFALALMAPLPVLALFHVRQVAVGRIT